MRARVGHRNPVRACILAIDPSRHASPPSLRRRRRRSAVRGEELGRGSYNLSAVTISRLVSEQTTRYLYMGAGSGDDGEVLERSGQWFTCGRKRAMRPVWCMVVAPCQLLCLDAHGSFDVERRRPRRRRRRNVEGGAAPNAPYVRTRRGAGPWQLLSLTLSQSKLLAIRLTAEHPLPHAQGGDGRRTLEAARTASVTGCPAKRFSLGSSYSSL